VVLHKLCLNQNGWESRQGYERHLGNKPEQVEIMRRLLIIGVLTLVFGATAGIGHARALYDVDNPRFRAAKLAASEPYVTIGVHKIGKIAMTVSNQGHFGKGYVPGLTDPLDGGQAPSCAFPYPCQQSYLFAGGFWVGAVIGRDTLVSTGLDGWRGTMELWPDPEPRGRIIYRTLLNTEDKEAISEQDYISMYTDTVTRAQYVPRDPIDGRPHMPLGIEVTQRSYAWSYAYAEDFVLFDYSIKNIGYHELEQVYMGFYVDGDVTFGEGAEGYDDDICGFKRDIPSPFGCGFVDTINIAYIADNDGKQTKSVPCPYTINSLTAVTGMRVVRTPSDSLKYSFNWWISNGAPSLDFGPRKVGTPDDPFRDFGGYLGTPEGDRNKYYIMRHEEFDYDQLFSAVDHTGEGWLPRSEQAADFADGYDTRYLLSFGPFDISPGEVLPISFAYIAGDYFHTNCDAFRTIFDAYNPMPFYEQLGFEDFGLNAMWASWIYDNPGVDTDDNGYKGKYRVCGYESLMVLDTLQEDPLVIDTSYIYTLADTLYYEGDGVPDFRGAAPPPIPELWVIDTLGDTIRSRITPRVDKYNQGELRVQWNGYRSETTEDFFSNEIDFEGYRVYLSLSPRASDFVLVSTHDKEDFNKYIWNEWRRIWQLQDPPFTLDSLRILYGENFDPLMYDRDYPLHWEDSLFYFGRQDWNESDYRDTIKIHKIYPDEPPPTRLNIDTARIHYPEELTEDGFFRYFEYEYVIRHLLPSQQYYVSVTAFDYGSPNSGLASLENPPARNYVAEYAQNSNTEVERRGLNVIVYPNPYRIDADYATYGFEARDYIDSTFGGALIPQEGLIPDRTRALHFTNLPPKCTIRIFTIDGDLVRKIEHDFPPDSPRSMHERWDLITRNTQAVVSGIYYYSVESEFGNQIGKIVIIL
jgi:hypothetical protein